MMNFDQVAKALHHIANTSSTLHKELLLREYANLRGFKDVLQFIYDPYFTTGIGDRKLENTMFVAMEPASPERIMEYLRKNNTGSAEAAEEAAAFVLQYAYSDISSWAARGLVTKDLQTGVSVTTLNKVYGPGFIAKVGIMRGMQCPDNIQGLYIATEKIDGNRRLIMNKDTGVEIYTRSGKRDYGLVELEEQAARLPKGYVYDCECVAMGDFDNSLALRQASASIMNSKGKRSGVKALIFDMLPQVEYNVGKSRLSAFARKAMLCYLFDDADGLKMLMAAAPNVSQAAWSALCPTPAPFYSVLDGLVPTHQVLPNITALPILGIVRNYDEALRLAQPIWESGGEGIMLNEFKSPYEVNPNPRKTLLKIKLNHEYTLRCVDVVGGEGKYLGMLGAIVVEYQRPGDPTVYEVKVGSGFTDEDRAFYWEHPWEIIGKMVEIECFGESRNAQGSYSLNCPIFKRIAGAAD